MTMLHAQNADTTQRKPRRPIRVYGDFGWVFGMNSSDFFRDYRVEQGGSLSTIPPAMALHGGIGSYMWDDVVVGVHTGYYRGVFREVYDRDVPLTDSTTAMVTTTQDFRMSVVPALVTIDYFPLRRQFTGYVGGGVGIASTSTYWSSSNSPLPGEISSTNAVQVDESTVVPAFMVRAGISLGWDRAMTTKTTASSTFEVRYTYIPVTVHTEQGDYLFTGGGIQFSIGVSVFLR